MVKKKLSIISPTRDMSNGNPRFISEKFAKRETDKRKKVIESVQNFVVD